MWPANSCDLNPIDYCIWSMVQKRVHQVPIRDMHELRKRLIETWAEFQHSLVDHAINQWHKRQKCAFMQTVVTLHSLAVTLLGWHSTCHTTQLTLFTATSATQHNSPFQSHQRLEGNHIPSITRMSSAFHKVVQWHLSGVMGKFAVTVTVRFILR